MATSGLESIINLEGSEPERPESDDDSPRFKRRRTAPVSLLTNDSLKRSLPDGWKVFAYSCGTSTFKKLVVESGEVFSQDGNLSQGLNYQKFGVEMQGGAGHSQGMLQMADVKMNPAPICPSSVCCDGVMQSERRCSPHGSQTADAGENSALLSSPPSIGCDQGVHEDTEHPSGVSETTDQPSRLFRELNEVLPEVAAGWKVLKRKYGPASAQPGAQYLRFVSLNGKHRGIGSVRKLIQLDSADKNLDPAPLLDKYEEMKANRPKAIASLRDPEAKKAAIQRFKEAIQRFRDRFGKLDGKTVFQFPGWTTRWKCLPCQQTMVTYFDTAGHGWKLLEDLEYEFQKRIEQGEGVAVEELIRAGRNGAAADGFTQGSKLARESGRSCEGSPQSGLAVIGDDEGKVLQFKRVATEAERTQEGQAAARQRTSKILRKKGRGRGKGKGKGKGKRRRPRKGRGRGKGRGKATGDSSAHCGIAALTENTGDGVLLSPKTAELAKVEEGQQQLQKKTTGNPVEKRDEATSECSAQCGISDPGSDKGKSVAVSSKTAATPKVKEGQQQVQIEATENLVSKQHEVTGDESVQCGISDAGHDKGEGVALSPNTLELGKASDGQNQTEIQGTEHASERPCDAVVERFRSIFGRLSGAVVFQFPGWRVRWQYGIRLRVCYIGANGQVYYSLTDVERALQRKIDAGDTSDIPAMIECAKRHVNKEAFSQGPERAKESGRRCEGSAQNGIVVIGEEGEVLQGSPKAAEVEMDQEEQHQTVDAPCDATVERFRERFGRLSGAVVFQFPGWKLRWRYYPNNGQVGRTYIGADLQEYHSLKAVEHAFQVQIESGDGSDIVPMIESATKLANIEAFSQGYKRAKESRSTCEGSAQYGIAVLGEDDSEVVNASLGRPGAEKTQDGQQQMKMEANENAPDGSCKATGERFSGRSERFRAKFGRLEGAAVFQIPGCKVRWRYNPGGSVNRTFIAPDGRQYLVLKDLECAFQEELETANGDNISVMIETATKNVDKEAFKRGADIAKESRGICEGSAEHGITVLSAEAGDIRDDSLGGDPADETSDHDVAARDAACGTLDEQSSDDDDGLLPEFTTVGHGQCNTCDEQGHTADSCGQGTSEKDTNTRLLYWRCELPSCTASFGTIYMDDPYRNKRKSRHLSSQLHAAARDAEEKELQDQRAVSKGDHVSTAVQMEALEEQDMHKECASQSQACGDLEACGDLVQSDKAHGQRPAASMSKNTHTKKKFWRNQLSLRRRRGQLHLQAMLKAAKRVSQAKKSDEVAVLSDSDPEELEMLSTLAPACATDGKNSSVPANGPALPDSMVPGHLVELEELAVAAAELRKVLAQRTFEESSELVAVTGCNSSGRLSGLLRGVYTKLPARVSGRPAYQKVRKTASNDIGVEFMPVYIVWDACHKHWMICDKPSRTKCYQYARSPMDGQRRPDLKHVPTGWSVRDQKSADVQFLHDQGLAVSPLKAAQKEISAQEEKSFDSSSQTYTDPV